MLPSIVRAVVHWLRRHGRILRDQGPEAYARWTILKARLAWMNRRSMHEYRFVSADEARARRRSDRVFVFGSGYSLNALTTGEWEHIAEHDVLGFSGFVYQQWVRTDFHLVRGWDYGEAAAHRRWQSAAETYAAKIAANPRFASTLFVMQDEYQAVFARTLVGCRLLPRGSAILRYRTAAGDTLMPTRSLADGLAHGTGTLCDVVNLAFALGWKEIVLVGVDLYDSRYFWAPPDATVAFDASGEMVPAARNFRGTGAADVHPVVRNGLVDVMARWHGAFAESGVGLCVYNPRSLLAQVMPVYEAAPARTGIAGGQNIL